MRQQIAVILRNPSEVSGNGGKAAGDAKKNAGVEGGIRGGEG